MDPSNPAEVDTEQVKKMVDLFIEKGFTDFDTAWMYNGFASESVAKEVLVNRFSLTTKLLAGFFDSLEGRDNVCSVRETSVQTGAGIREYPVLEGGTSRVGAVDSGQKSEEKYSISL